MKKYIQPEVKEAKVSLEALLDDGFIHTSEGSGIQLSNEADFDDLNAEGENNQGFRSVWDEE